MRKHDKIVRIYVHPETKEVWYATGDEVASNTHVLSHKAVFKENVFKDTTGIKIIGSADHAGLILKYQQLIASGKLPVLTICSPRLCMTTAEKNDPDFVLFEMRKLRIASSLGGWHVANAHDTAHYSLAALTTKSVAYNKLTPEDRHEQLLYHVAQHPAYKHASCIKHLDTKNLAILLGIIIDPRWYIDLDHPDSGAKLKAYLGMTPKNADGVLNDAATADQYYDRYKLVLRTWKTTTKQPDNASIRLPHNFLWRVWVKHDDKAKADLRVSQLFLAFLRHTWLHELYASVRQNQEPLFVPEYFFELAEDIAYYKNHVSKFNNAA